jgi:hypothetical protein
VIDRRVADAGYDQAVGRLRGGQAELGAAVHREREAHGTWQVGGDGGGLRDDVQLGVTEDLVPAAGDRLGRRGDDAEEYVR